MSTEATTAAKWSYSTDEEHYHGEFDTREAACDEAAAHVGVGRAFWVGENRVPRQPETFWLAELWLERVSEQDDYLIDAAEGWNKSTREQQQELEVCVRSVLGAWLDKHNLRPSFWLVENPQKFYVAGKVGEVYEIEAL